MPGSGTLNAGGDATITTVACAAVGDCTAGGSYENGSGKTEAFVAAETNGVWGAAREVPGTSVLNADGNASVSALSCAAIGACTVGGSYINQSSQIESFVATEAKGVWKAALEVPGTSTLNVDGNAFVNSLSCAAAGDCAVGGGYEDASGRYQVFVDTQRNGVWGTALEVPGTAKLNADGNASVNSISCAAVSACVVGGNYENGSGLHETYVATENNGTWHTATELAGTAALNVGGNAALASLSCATAGNCSAGGTYEDGSGAHQAFVASEINGVWHTATELTGTSSLNVDGNASVVSLACRAAGFCAAGGNYEDGSGNFQAFVATQSHGTWTSASDVPGAVSLNVDGDASVNSVACAAIGDCAAGGSYVDGSNDLQAFVVTDVNGRWSDAIEVPGSGTLNVDGDGEIASVSCTKAGPCLAGGSYLDGASHGQTLVTTFTPQAPHVSGLSPAHGPRAGGTVVTVSGTGLFDPSLVRFGATTAKVLTYLSPSKIEVKAPRGSGTVDVTVRTAGGTSVTSTIARFTYTK